MKRKLLLFSAAFTLAAVYCCVFSFGGGVYIAAGAAVLCILLFVSAKRYRPIAVLLFGFAVGLLWCSGYNALMEQKLQPRYLGMQTVSAQVLQRPRQTKYGYLVFVRFRLESGSFEGTLYYGDEPETMNPGDEITCDALLKRASEGEDYVNYNAARGVWIAGNATSDLTVTPRSGFSLATAPARLSCRLQDLCGELFSDKTDGFATALLTGNRQKLDKLTAGSLKRAGIYHVVAISGMHTSILVGALLMLLRGRRKLAAVIGIPIVVIFVLMSGASPSAMRAGVMQILFLSSFLFRRESDPPTSLGAAMLVLLIINPWMICSVSLQLSFAAVVGILLFAERIMLTAYGMRFYRNIFHKSVPLRRIFDTFAAAFACSVSAAAFTLPLQIVYYGQYAVLTPLSNVLSAWAVISAFALGLLALLVGLVWLPLGMLAAKPVELLLRFVLWISETLSKIPFSVAAMDSPYFAAWLCFAYVLLLLMLFVRKMPKLVPTVCMLALYGVCILLSCMELRTAEFAFTALDVGQGQCLVLTAKDKTVVIDCGGSDEAQTVQTATDYLTACGAKKIDALILTHYDLDHIGGAAALMERYAVGTLYLPEKEQTEGIRAVLAAAENGNTAVETVTNLKTVQLGGIQLQIFDASQGKKSANAGICVLASCGEYDMLVTGDLPVGLETKLLLRYKLPQTEILVAGHHGAENATGHGILKTLKPELVLISVGENSYGQPSGKTLERIRTYGAEVYRTDLCGNITVRR